MQFYNSNPHRNCNVKKIPLPIEEWLLPCRRIRKWFVDIAKKKGARVMWGSQGILLFSPYDQEKIYTDERVIDHLKNQLKLPQQFINKWFVFIKDFMKDEQILQAKEYYKGYRLTKNDEGFSFNVAIIKECLEECDKEQQMHKKKWREMIINYAQNARHKAKELEFCVESVQFELEALVKLMVNYLALKYYYKTIKYLRKALNLNNLLKYKGDEYDYIFHKSDSKKLIIKYENNQLNILEIFNAISIVLKQLNLVYIINTNKLIYQHQFYSFHCKGYYILKHKKGQTLKGRIREKRVKRCGNCKFLMIKGRKSATRKNKKFKRYKCSKCQQVYYCNKSCQKRHWNHHKLICH